MPAGPSKSGYVFGGWYTAKNGGGSQFTAETTVIGGDITVYARWTAQYTVTFDADDGSTAAQTRTVLDGNSVGVSGMPADPVRSNYTFSGWYTSTNGGGTQFTASTTVSGNITVYAKWTVIQYTVTFNADGGIPATQTKTVNSGGSVGVNMPSEPAKNSYTFDGWYTAINGGGTQFTASTTVSGNITVYAKWTEWTDLSLNEALTWINTNAVEGGSYTITVKNNETIAPRELSCGGKNVSITIMGDTVERTLGLSSNGPIFTLESGVTLTLENNITLQGRNDNTASLVRVNSGGTLVMNTGSKISDNTSSDSYPGGGGAGVHVYSGGTFTMNGGAISGNTSSYHGGGVSSGDGVFVMNGGEISGNTSPNYGGGVTAGTFTMNGGQISGNTCGSAYAGGGVYASTFTMNGGIVSGNTARHGGGVSVPGPGGTITMRGGTISGNTARMGGGVYTSGTFTMSGGTISGNTATGYFSNPEGGGGVYIGSGGTFTKQSGGTIYGSNTDIALKNTAVYGDSYGHAVYVDISPAKKRNTTAGVGVTLDRTKGGAAGGWE
jgi:uncharacterized repeat protein (TIGR02543 family)